MASLNKVILIATLGKDPEVRHMPNGDAVANFSVATNEKWKDKQGQQQERTEWHNIVIYRRLAEIAGQYLKKGSQVYLEGKLQTRKWEKDGVDRYTTEIVVDQMQMLGGKGERSQAAPSPAPERQQTQASSAKFEEFEDEIPF